MKEKGKARIYVVSNWMTNETIVVKAISAAQAIRVSVLPKVDVRIADAVEVADLLFKGADMIDAIHHDSVQDSIDKAEAEVAEGIQSNIDLILRAPTDCANKPAFYVAEMIDSLQSDDLAWAGDMKPEAEKATKRAVSILKDMYKQAQGVDV